mmetsp:Transcript_30522/g.27031  ORF Transcript_30522/g.27031 Transcript_30522/m.27031 type:complete len:205 (+) Transcript_30522:374-988(+)
MYLLGKVSKDYPNDSVTIAVMTILVISCTYICVVSMALEVVIMLIIMIFMTISIFFCFLCVFFCPRCLAWRPRNDNDRIDRHYFMGIVNGNGTWEHVLQYIYQHKRRHFKKDRYKWYLDEGLKEEVKDDIGVFANKEIMRLDTDKDEVNFKGGDNYGVNNDVNDGVMASPKISPETGTSSEFKIKTISKEEKKKRKIDEKESIL